MWATKYCRTFVEWLRYVENAPEDFKKIMLTKFLDFKNITEKLNKGEFLVVDLNHYNKQADYIEKIFKPKK